jgi:hypothetical protein
VKQLIWRKLHGGGYKMNALFWKKNKELLNSKKFIVVLFISAIITVFMIIRPIELNKLIFGLFLFNSLLYWIILFSIEDFIFAEAILGTKIAIKDIWLNNIIVNNLYSFIGAIIQLTIVLGVTNRLKDIEFINILDCIMSIMIGFGLTAFSTFYISDYSKIRNLISSIGGIINILLFFYMISVRGNIYILYENRYYVLTVSLILLLFSARFVLKFTNSEKFIINIKKIGQAYDNSKSIDE